MHPIPFLDKNRVDQYFLNTIEVLKSENRNPSVVMEVFANADGLLCGIDEVVDVLCETLPGDAQIWALNDGAVMSRKEVVLRIHTDYCAVGAFETALLGTLAHGSGWATASRCGGLTPDRMSEFVRLDCPIAGFGVGSAISGARPIDFTADLKEVDGQPIAKRGRKVGIQVNLKLERKSKSIVEQRRED